jgi:hypothetical protein
MREQLQCAECKRETAAGALCTLCGAPLTWQPITPTDYRPAAPRRDIPARVGVGFVLAAFSAWLLTLNVVAGTHPLSAPDYEAPGEVALNVAILGPIIAIGLGLMIWGVRRRRR